MNVPELRKEGQRLGVKDYHVLKRTELVREIRKKTEKSIAKEDVIKNLKECHQLVDNKVNQMILAGKGSSSYRGVREQIRAIINRVEKFSD